MLTVNAKNIDLALYCFFFTLPFIGYAIPIGSSFGIQVSFIFAIILIIYLFIIVTLRKKISGVSGFPKSIVSILLIVYYLICVVSLLMALDLPFQEIKGEFPLIKGMKQLTGLTFCVSMYFALVSFINSERRFRNCIRIFLISAIAVTLLGMYQFISSYYELNLPLESLARYNVSHGEFGEQGRHGARGAFRRVASVFVEPSFFADFLVIIVSLMLSGAYFKEYLFVKSRFLFLSLLSLFFVMLVLLFSRAAYVGFIFSVIFFFWITGLFNPFRLKKCLRLSKIFYFIVLPLGIYILISSMPDLFDAISQTVVTIDPATNVSSLERATMLVTQYNIFKEYPLLGVGFGHFGFYYDEFKPDWGFAVSESLNAYPPAQNIYGEILSETGMIGMIIFILIIINVVRTGRKTFKYSSSRFHKAFSAGAISGFIGFMITMLAVGGFYNLPFMWPLMSLIVAQNNLLKKQYLK